MANTLNLGNGNWATKEDSLLAYNSENGNFKPLPFDFTRASSATVVNKAGLIETVGSGEARIDFSKDDSKGALLLEPTRSNLIPYSEDFSNAAWAKQSVTITSNSVISPDGSLNADKITDDSTNGAHRMTEAFTTSSTGSFTYSIFLKKGTLTTAQFQLFNSATASSANVDLVNGTITSDGTGVDHKIENYGNDWFKCSISGTLSNTTTTVYLYLKQKPSYIGNEDYLYAWGAQLEQGSYATSYIPNFGNSAGATRSADVCNNGGNEQVINSTEGVLYAEISGFENDTSFRTISLSDGSNINEVQLLYSGNTNIIRVILTSNAVTQVDFNYTMTNGVNYNKIAFTYKQNNFQLWVNGIKRQSDTIGNTSNNLNKIRFQNGVGSANFYGNVKDIKLYNTALTDSELTALTKI